MAPSEAKLAILHILVQKEIDEVSQKFKDLLKQLSVSEVNKLTKLKSIMISGLKHYCGGPDTFAESSNEGQSKTC